MVFWATFWRPWPCGLVTRRMMSCSSSRKISHYFSRCMAAGHSKWSCQHRPWKLFTFEVGKIHTWTKHEKRHRIVGENYLGIGIFQLVPSSTTSNYDPAGLSDGKWWEDGHDWQPWGWVMLVRHFICWSCSFKLFPRNLWCGLRVDHFLNAWRCWWTAWRSDVQARYVWTRVAAWRWDHLVATQTEMLIKVHSCSWYLCHNHHEGHRWSSVHPGPTLVRIGCTWCILL